MSTVERLQAILDSRTFNWEQDEKTLLDALRQLKQLQLAREIHEVNLKRFEAILANKS